MKWVLAEKLSGYIKCGEYRAWPTTSRLVNKVRDLRKCPVPTELLNFSNALSRFRVEAR